jgi:hypothetical protein
MPTTTFSLQLARSANGNWSLTPSDNLAAHPVHPLPPMAFPASMTALQAMDYGNAMLPLAHVPAPDRLSWHLYGHSAHDGSPAYRAMWNVTITAIADPKGA